MFDRYGNVKKVIIYNEKQSEDDDGDVIVKIFVEFSAMSGESWFNRFNFCDFSFLLLVNSDQMWLVVGMNFVPELSDIMIHRKKYIRILGTYLPTYFVKSNMK